MLARLGFCSVLAALVLGGAGGAGLKKLRTGTTIGELKAVNPAKNKRDIVIDVLAAGDEKPRGYTVGAHQKELLALIRAVKIGARVEVVWFDTVEGLCVEKFRVLTKEKSERSGGPAGLARGGDGNKPTVIELWPGKVPDEPGTIGPEKVVMSPKFDRKMVEVTESTAMLSNVTRPSITIYRPAKEKDTGAAVLICPGGGYWNLFWELEGEEVAAWLNALGVTGIILKYRVPRRPDEPKGVPARRPLQDAQRAVSLVRAHAAAWGIDPKRIGMIGFSAGGHLAIAAATSFEKRTYEPQDDSDKMSCRPDFAILAYSGYLKDKDKDELSPSLRVPAETPPVFLVHGGADLISTPEHSVLMYLALKRAGVSAELHIYADTAHDFAVRSSDRPFGAWTQACAAWLRDRGFLASKR